MLARPRIVGDEGSEYGIGAFKERGEAAVIDFHASVRDIREQLGDRVRDRGITSRGQELANLVHRPALFDRSEEAC
jgi:hypothetical protein